MKQRMMIDGKVGKQPFLLLYAERIPPGPIPDIAYDPLRKLVQVRVGNAWHDAVDLVDDSNWQMSGATRVSRETTDDE
jgi:hypothetical protein